MTNKQIRWKQRFENFSKAFNQLSSAVEAFETLDDLSKEGMVQRFEYTFELAWKTLKDYLESQGETEKFPRAVIKKSYQYDLIDNGEVWMQMLENRNLMAHTYNEEIFNEVVTQIVGQFYNQISLLKELLDTEYNEK